jgi:hypothetical protein
MRKSMLQVIPLFVATLLVMALPSVALAQTIPPEEKDHAIVYELGWASDWSHADGFNPKGGTVAFEVTPIEHWLELEFGVTAVHADGSTEIPFDVLFKKPWTLSPKFEFMLGLGPELIHETGPEHGTFWGLSSVLDLMFWPSRNVGWYLEPGYEASFRAATIHQGLGMAAGLIIGR